MSVNKEEATVQWNVSNYWKLCTDLARVVEFSFKRRSDRKRTGGKDGLRHRGQQDKGKGCVSPWSPPCAALLLSGDWVKVNIALLRTKRHCCHWHCLDVPDAPELQSLGNYKGLDALYQKWGKSQIYIYFSLYVYIYIEMGSCLLLRLVLNYSWPQAIILLASQSAEIHICISYYVYVIISYYFYLTHQILLEGSGITS